jgi:hypothetical protein
MVAIRKKRVSPEHEEQKMLFEWSNGFGGNLYPELKLMFAITNGAFYGADRRMAAIQSNKLKSEGLKPGVPDIFLPFPSSMARKVETNIRKQYHGMFIEMKAGKNDLSDEQKEWIAKLTQLNYYCVVCYSFTEAKLEILKYLGKLK